MNVSAQLRAAARKLYTTRRLLEDHYACEREYRKLIRALGHAPEPHEKISVLLIYKACTCGALGWALSAGYLLRPHRIVKRICNKAIELGIDGGIFWDAYPHGNVCWARKQYKKQKELFDILFGGDV